MATINNINNIKKAQKVIIYWDYENCPIPTRATSFGNVIDVIKRKIHDYLQYEIPVETRIYIAADKIPNKIKQEMDICSAQNIDIPSWKAEAVDKRILVDLALDLYEWGKNGNIQNVVCLISGDKDFGNILGRIHNAPEITNLVLIRLPTNDGKELPVNKNLYSCVDYIIDSNHGSGFVVEEFIDCKHGIKCNKDKHECRYYHHKTHYLHKQNSDLQSPYFDNDPEPKIDPRVRKARSRMHCRYGDNCKMWRKGICHFYHPTVYQGPYNKPCRWGDKCKDYPLGLCKYIHTSSPYQPQIQQQQELAQQQQQQIRAMLSYNNNNNNNNNNNGNNKNENYKVNSSSN